MLGKPIVVDCTDPWRPPTGHTTRRLRYKYVGERLTMRGRSTRSRPLLTSPSSRLLAIFPPVSSHVPPRRSWGTRPVRLSSASCADQFHSSSLEPPAHEQCPLGSGGACTLLQWLWSSASVQHDFSRPCTYISIDQVSSLAVPIAPTSFC